MNRGIPLTGFSPQASSYGGTFSGTTLPIFTTSSATDFRQNNNERHPLPDFLSSPNNSFIGGYADNNAESYQHSYQNWSNSNSPNAAWSLHYDEPLQQSSSGSDRSLSTEELENNWKKQFDNYPTADLNTVVKSGDTPSSDRSSSVEANQSNSEWNYELFRLSSDRQARVRRDGKKDVPAWNEFYSKRNPMASARILAPKVQRKPRRTGPIQTRYDPCRSSSEPQARVRRDGKKEVPASNWNEFNTDSIPIVSAHTYVPEVQHTPPSTGAVQYAPGRPENRNLARRASYNSCNGAFSQNDDTQTRKRKRSLDEGHLEIPSTVQVVHSTPIVQPVTQRLKLDESQNCGSWVWFDEAGNVVDPEPRKTPEKLYHYTTKDGAAGILADGYLRVTEQSVVKYGTGIYFTDIPPTATTREIVLNNYNNLSFKKIPRTEYCFEFKSRFIPGLDFCVDNNWGYQFVQGYTGKERSVWKSSVLKLHLKNSKGIYYQRELNGLELPKAINTLTWEM